MNRPIKINYWDDNPRIDRLWRYFITVSAIAFFLLIAAFLIVATSGNFGKAFVVLASSLVPLVIAVLLGMRIEWMMNR